MGDITVTVVDDQAMVRQGFAALLGAQPDITVVGDAADGAQAVEQVTRLHPDVVFMDVRMPVMNGLEAARRILSAGLDPAPKIVMLTTFDLDDYVFEALQMGCSGFLLKDAPAGELVRAVRLAVTGEALLAPSVTKRLIEDAVAKRPAGRIRGGGDAAGQAAQRAQRALKTLTPREHEILEQIATGRSNQEIAGTLFISEETVKTHVRKVLQKLSLRDRVQAVVFAYENGVA
ncbi:response regulator [Corynebacterium variabile]|uniref:response regulator n=1 Tax=Corynebacterium variabile TaxID=1727 RepID=UPI001E11E263|nr:response regulator transcription factor [Corynebacterium variabile]HJG45158.1 response regulator transcription factor [Corynebacterium variabile]